MQDGATIHTSNMACNFLNDVFGQRVMSGRRQQGVDWAPNSPDMSPCDFWLHGHLKVGHSMHHSIIHHCIIHHCISINA